MVWLQFPHSVRRSMAFPNRPVTASKEWWWLMSHGDAAGFMAGNILGSECVRCFDTHTGKVDRKSERKARLVRVVRLLSCGWHNVDSAVQISR